MPRQSIKQMKGRTQVSPQATFDFTVPRREVHAGPVGMPTVAPKVDTKRTAILQFIDSMQGLAKDVKGWSDEANIERRKAGKMARGREEDLPEDPHWAFLEGYELMSGASDAYTYEKELAKLLDTDIHSDVGDFNAKKDEISNKYLTGRTDAYIEGFISRGMNVEANAEMKYQEAQTERMQTDFLTKGIKLFKFDSREHRETGAGMLENSKADRELLTELQELAEPYGLSKLQVSESIVDAVGSDRAMRGEPENLMFLFEPDVKGGTALIDNPHLATKINRYVNSAISTRKSMTNETRLEKERIEDEFAVTAGKAIVKSLDNNDPTTAIKILEDTGKYMSFDNYKSLTAAIADMRERTDTFFASTTNQFDFDNLRIAARSGALSLEALQDHKEALTKADYRRVFGDIVIHWQEKVARSRAGGKKTKAEITMEKARNDGHTLVKQTSKVGDILNPLGADRRAVHFTVHFDDIYKERAELVRGAEKMKAEDRQYVIDKTVYNSFIYEPPAGGEKMPPNPDAKVKDVRQPDTTSDRTGIEDDLDGVF